jgi:hypothetical protein
MLWPMPKPVHGLQARFSNFNLVNIPNIFYICVLNDKNKLR